jgi:hypothetical protein
MTRDHNTIVGGEVVQGSELHARVRHRNHPGGVVVDIQGVLQGDNALRRLSDGTHRLYIAGPLVERKAERMTIASSTVRQVMRMRAFIQRHPFASVYLAGVITYNIQEWIR